MNTPSYRAAFDGMLQQTHQAMQQTELQAQNRALMAQAQLTAGAQEDFKGQLAAADTTQAKADALLLNTVNEKLKMPVIADLEGHQQVAAILQRLGTTDPAAVAAAAGLAG